MVVIMQSIHKKADLRETKANATKQERLIQTEVNFVLRKNGGHNPSGLASRLIAVVSEWVNEWVSEWVRWNTCSLQTF